MPPPFSEKGVSWVVEKTPFPLYVLKGKPFGFNLVDISIQFWFETVDYLVFERYANPEISPNWWLGDNISIQVGHNLKLPDYIAKISPQRQKIKLINTDDEIELLIFSASAYPTITIKTSIGGEEIIIQADMPGDKLNRDEIISVARHLVRLQAGDALIKELESQRMAMRKKMEEEMSKNF